MTEVIEQTFACPYCWQPTVVEVDLSVGSQEFIEDCTVCCQPIQIAYRVEEGALLEFETSRSQ